MAFPGERAVRDGMQALGSFDGEGRLRYWNLHAGMGATALVGRIWFTPAPTSPVIADALKQAGVADSPTVASQIAGAVETTLMAALDAVLAEPNAERMAREAAAFYDWALGEVTAVTLTAVTDSVVAASAGQAVVAWASGVVGEAAADARAPAPPPVERRSCYAVDHLGSVRATVNEQGTAVEGRDYYPFGLEMPGRVYTQSARTQRPRR